MKLSLISLALLAYTIVTVTLICLSQGGVLAS